MYCSYWYMNFDWWAEIPKYWLPSKEKPQSWLCPWLTKNVNDVPNFKHFLKYFAAAGSLTMFVHLQRFMQCPRHPLIRHHFSFGISSVWHKLISRSPETSSSPNFQLAFFQLLWQRLCILLILICSVHQLSSGFPSEFVSMTATGYGIQVGVPPMNKDSGIIFLVLLL